MRPQNVPFMNTIEETKSEMVRAAGIEPAAERAHSKPNPAIQPVAQGELLQPPVAQTEFSPQSSPTGPTVKRHKSKQDYATPWEFITPCRRRFGDITWDLAATIENAKAPKYYALPQFDSLQQPWHEHRGVLWLNPPFNDIAPWAAKCAAESALGARILFLTPASIGSNWFRDHVHGKARVLALNGRITFLGADDPYPKDCILSVFGCEQSGFDVWSWKERWES